MQFYKINLGSTKNAQDSILFFIHSINNWIMSQGGVTQGVESLSLGLRKKA